ncbi:MAG: hypothetical protein U5K38_14380 [Woeseiaceae bacterium]|nr:hypothetical protein [Woeseiaceae bacterium]
MSDYYGDAEMARLLGISLGRLRNKLSAGDPLPACIRPPGCRKRLWHRESVHRWLEEQAVRPKRQARPAASRYRIQ